MEKQDRQTGKERKGRYIMNDTVFEFVSFLFFSFLSEGRIRVVLCFCSLLRFWVVCMMWGFSSLSIAFYYYRLLTRLYLLARCIDKRRLLNILRPVLCARLARWPAHAEYLKYHLIYIYVYIFYQVTEVGIASGCGKCPPESPERIMRE